MNIIENKRIRDKVKKLGLHETLTINDQTDVMKVPGGLLYITKVYQLAVNISDRRIAVASTFVPLGIDS